MVLVVPPAAAGPPSGELGFGIRRITIAAPQLPGTVGYRAVNFT